jgi:hypothetical protein
MVARTAAAAAAAAPAPHHGVCLLARDAPVDVNVAGLHATQPLQGLADHDGAAAQRCTLALCTAAGHTSSVSTHSIESIACIACMTSSLAH